MADRRAVVTGASGGIGRALAAALAAQGYAVTAVARSEDKLATLVAELGDGHDYLVADLSTPEGIAAAEASLQASHTHLLINNAGIGTYRAFHEVDLARAQMMLRLNMDAVVTLSHAFLTQAQAGDALMNVSSALSFMPMPFAAAYSASKAFVTAFSETLWYENKGRDVFVTALCPGVTETDFHNAAGGEDRNAPPKILIQSPEQVAAEALAALRRRASPSVVTGFLNKLGAFQSRILPRSALVSIMGMNAPQK